MASWVFSLNANRMVVIHSQKWCLSLYRIREWFGKVTDKFVSRKIFQKFSVYLHFLSPLLCVFPRLLRPRSLLFQAFPRSFACHAQVFDF